MFGWLTRQLVGWEEIAVGVGLMTLALFAEDWIDQWRERRRR